MRKKLAAVFAGACEASGEAFMEFGGGRVGLGSRRDEAGRPVIGERDQPIDVERERTQPRGGPTDGLDYVVELSSIGVAHEMKREVDLFGRGFPMRGEIQPAERASPGVHDLRRGIGGDEEPEGVTAIRGHANSVTAGAGRCPGALRCPHY